MTPVEVEAFIDTASACLRMDIMWTSAQGIFACSPSGIGVILTSYNPEALYTMDRADVNIRIEDSLTVLLAPLGIIVEQAPIDNIDLPVTLRNAIVAKQEAEQEALRMEYVIQAQVLESERMRIEAQGIADYQRIVSTGLTEQLLSWKAIELTGELAQSDNTTFVIVGDTGNGLPMIYQPQNR